MKPSAQFRSAQEILETLVSSEMSPKVLINWGRQNRFAGSKDRRKIRDIVYYCLRNKRYLLNRWSNKERKGDGRNLVLSFLYDHYHNDHLTDFNIFFGSRDFDLQPLSDTERNILSNKFLKREAIREDPVKYSYPDFLDKSLKRSLGKDFSKIMELFLKRASVFVRANKIKISTKDLTSKLKAEGFEVESQIKNRDALKVLNASNKLKLSEHFSEGLFEFQDLGSQQVVNNIVVKEGMSILDFCAGGGGKSLALASHFSNNIELYAYDLNSSRLKPFKIRAERACAKIKFLDDRMLFGKSFDAVIVDAPCSGSGTWRRDPFTKWNLTLSEISKLSEIQCSILNQVASYVNKSGLIFYITCSLLDEENGEVISRFLKNSNDYCLEREHFVSPLEGGDGFFLSVLKKNK